MYEDYLRAASTLSLPGALLLSAVDRYVRSLVYLPISRLVYEYVRQAR